VLRTSKRPEPVNLVHCPSCDRHEPFCYSCRHRPTPKNTLRGNPGCAVGPKTPTQTERVLDPSAGEVEVPPGSQAELPVPRKPLPVLAVQEGDPQVIVAASGQSVSRASGAPKARMAPKLAARRTSTVPSGVEVRDTSPQARLIMARSG
jgi:hypothetical protein